MSTKMTPEIHEVTPPGLKKRRFFNSRNREHTINVVILKFAMIVISLALLYPFIYVISASISSPQAVSQNKVLLFPVGPINFEAFRLVLADSRIWTGYGNTILYTSTGVLVNMLITVLAAYPMSRRNFAGRKFMNVFVSASMFISATGLLVPLFLIVRGIGLYDNRLSVIIVFAAFPFFIILMRSFFESLPEAIIESARIDGLNEFHILLRIVLPLSGAAMATIALYYLINRWNGYFWAMIFLPSPEKHPLQVVLRELIVVARMGEEMDANMDRANTTATSVQYAAIIVSTLPIAVIYPFIQKYFVKGVNVGAVKG